MNKITVTERAIARTDDFYGIFFEDINHAADGGLYGELVRNRAFEFSPMDNPDYQALTAWKKLEQGGASVSAMVSNKSPLTAKNPNYLVLSITSFGDRGGIKNLGYNGGIAVKKDGKYRLSFYVRSQNDCTVTVSIDGAEGETRAAADINITSRDWTKYTAYLTASADDNSASLAITSTKSCKLQLDFVSLFPMDTYKNRENGMRRDIAEMLEALTPRFMRFPGGCLIHDGTLNKDDKNSMYRWKNTVGDITERAARRNNWQYNQSLGLGYYEYFLFCEDIGAKPLPVLPAGYNPHMEQAAPLDEMQEWIDDALDLIEFANGSADTKWGAYRAALGHSEPFGLEYIAIGNEEVGAGFWERYDLFHKAIKNKYPDIKIINSAGPFPAGGEFERGWANAQKNGSDFVDEHYYTSPEWLIANYHRYDSYPDSPKVFLGEYASWGNTYYNALAEAAYMTGLENNARVVGLACYAPLLANIGYVNWKPDMIWFDNHRVCGSANYYTQKMFMNNMGTELLELEKEGFTNRVTLGEPYISGAVELEADRCSGEVYDIKITDENGTRTADDAVFTNGGSVTLSEAVNSFAYTVEFTVKRTAGEKGFRLYFGKKDDKNFIQWFIGGWQNQDTELNAQVNGRGSSLDHNIFSIMTGKEYRLRLEVNGRSIQAYINGRLSNSAEDKRPVAEELYTSASRDDNYVYIKAVNILNNAVTSAVTVNGIDKTDGEVISISDCPLDSENSLDEPRRVFPRKTAVKADQNTFEYTFPKYSVTVFKLELTKNS